MSSVTETRRRSLAEEKTERPLETFKVLRVVSMKITVSWNVTPYGLLNFTDVSNEYAASVFRVEE
jgi:hypothetical protein